MIRVAIIGAAGLSGLELIRILTHHPMAELRVVTSDRHAGKRVGDAFPELSRVELVFSSHDAKLEGCDVAFLAIPNQASLEQAPRLLKQGLRVIDLSGVFRLADPDVFRTHYGLEHTAPRELREAVFGLPEAFRARIPKARLIANPGCYPTGALLGLLPLGDLLGGLAAPPIIDAKSGVSGAGGRVEDDATNFMEVNENFKAYKVFGHQHTPEIEQYLAECTPYAPARDGAVVFTPHLLPIGRGILSTIYLRFARPLEPEAVRRRFAAFAEREPFVHLLAAGRGAEVKMVQGLNDCVTSLHHDAEARSWVVITAIDNLGKGAAGQAVQNMNLMFGRAETEGLV
ncbi:MAG: N-acetyl-gamma-glutamyl-phosphate reductase [Candidatus Lambdaproteobacteria bacterium]|nr:N-acetyl-gamma-glutamyl-phosphate reductase [Candidatus Lambdaproteobacteria bacterium]